MVRYEDGKEGYYDRFRRGLTLKKVFGKGNIFPLNKAKSKPAAKSGGGISRFYNLCKRKADAKWQKADFRAEWAAAQI